MSTKFQRKRMTHADWMAEATKLFGSDPMNWRFVCPACKYVQSAADYKAAGAPETSIGFCCIGRYVGIKRDALGLNSERKDLPPVEGPGPCNYTCGGLINLAPIEVEYNGTLQMCFDFDRSELQAV